YQKAVKPVQHVYGKYGTLKKQYLEEMGIDWTIADLPTYLHGVDNQAEELQETMRTRLEQDERYKRTCDFMEDYRRQTEVNRLIEEEILNEIVYTGAVA
ncbi:MAG: hypothetical protein HDT28_04020, partial [Clostridiales bacterium]|nr:hypothetical protein [Clostridiales bacterium]